MGYLKKHSVLFSVFCGFLLLLVSSCGWNQSGTDQNVETFARLYGYVKYFYPSDEASRIDWERFAVYGVKQVEKIKDAGELKKKLEELFLPLAPVIEIYFTREKREFEEIQLVPRGKDIKGLVVVAWQHYGVSLSDQPNIYHSIRLNRKNELHLYTGSGDEIVSKTVDGPMRLFPQAPAIGEHINKKLGRGLSCIVPVALYADQYHTYPKAPEEAFKNLAAALENEDPKTWHVNQPHVRRAGIVIAWNVFQHFYPYFDVVNVDWKKVLPRTLRNTRDDRFAIDFLHTLREMTAQLQDGHGNVYHSLLIEQAGFPFKVQWIKKQLVITVSEDPANFKRGDIILSIDEKDALEFLEEAETRISGSPQWKRWRSTNRFGYGKKRTRARFKIKRDGKEIEAEFTAVRTQQGKIREFYRKNIEELKENIFYVDLGRAGMKEINGVIHTLARARGVIFDARGYVAAPKAELISYLTEKTVDSPVWNVPRIIYPDRANIQYDHSNWSIAPKNPKIGGKVVFLAGPGTISASETFMGIVAHYKLGEIVGSPTAGANGNINPFTLPGGYSVYWTGMRVLKQNYSQHHLIGIPPTVPVERTIAGVKAGRDECLEKALKLIVEGTPNAPADKI